MSVSPTPSDTGTAASGSNNDWRASVAQSYRSAEVREIAKVLASLEPGATQSSKLMLAMRFEDAIFNAATSLADYRKKLAKRLKKLQKNYKANASPAAPQSEAKRNEEKLYELKRKYGDALKFICRHAPAAIAILKEKHGSERASHLQQHTDNARQWAVDMGLLAGSRRKLMDRAALERLQSHLSQRVDNIRSHVVKMTQPDLFLQETLDKLQKDAQPTYSNTLAHVMLKRLQGVGWKDLYENPKKTLEASLEKALRTVPPPTRERKSQMDTAMIHLDTMRAASQALLAYLALANKETQLKKDDVMVRCHQVAVDGINYLQQVVPTLVPKDVQERKEIKLEDAWTKSMELPQEENDHESDVLHHKPPKRQKTGPLVLHTRVLLSPGRPCPSNLAAALKRKAATLKRCPQTNHTHLHLEFENAFVMTIYLNPLVVRIEPKPKPNTDWNLAVLEQVARDRLDYAEAHCTKILRECFAASGDAVKDFEVEISEATALLQFLQVARSTYMPHWQDLESK